MTGDDDLEPARLALAAAARAGLRRLAPLVRAMLPEIEHAQANGATLAEIAAALSAGGSPVKPNSLRISLYRSRKHRSRKGSREGKAATMPTRPGPGRSTPEPTAAPARKPQPGPAHWPTLTLPDPEPEKRGFDLVIHRKSDSEKVPDKSLTHP
jgi:hypothetical protein